MLYEILLALVGIIVGISFSVILATFLMNLINAARYPYWEDNLGSTLVRYFNKKKRDKLRTIINFGTNEDEYLLTKREIEALIDKKLMRYKKSKK